MLLPNVKVFARVAPKQKVCINPYLMNGFSHHYQLGESTFIFRGVRSIFLFLSHFLMKFLQANRIAPDGTPRSEVSHLGLLCLPMSLKKELNYEFLEVA